VTRARPPRSKTVPAIENRPSTYTFVQAYAQHLIYRHSLCLHLEFSDSRRRRRDKCTRKRLIRRRTSRIFRLRRLYVFNITLRRIKKPTSYLARTRPHFRPFPGLVCLSLYSFMDPGEGASHMLRARAPCRTLLLYLTLRFLRFGGWSGARKTNIVPNFFARYRRKRIKSSLARRN